MLTPISFKSKYKAQFKDSPSSRYIDLPKHLKDIDATYNKISEIEFNASVPDEFDYKFEDFCRYFGIKFEKSASEATIKTFSQLIKEKDSLSCFDFWSRSRRLSNLSKAQLGQIKQICIEKQAAETDFCDYKVEELPGGITKTTVHSFCDFKGKNETTEEYLSRKKSQRTTITYIDTQGQSGFMKTLSIFDSDDFENKDALVSYSLKEEDRMGLDTKIALSFDKNGVLNRIFFSDHRKNYIVDWHAPTSKKDSSCTFYHGQSSVIPDEKTKEAITQDFIRTVENFEAENISFLNKNTYLQFIVDLSNINDLI